MFSWNTEVAAGSGYTVQRACVVSANSSGIDSGAISRVVIRRFRKVNAARIPSLPNRRG